MIFLLAALLNLCIAGLPNWGFYAHRMLNRHAVFSLPPELIEFYKRNIQFISDHAVDADKRRYSVRLEGIRHYIDLDHWGDSAWYVLPRNYYEAILRYLRVYQITDDNLHLVFENDCSADSLTFTNRFKESNTVFVHAVHRKDLLPKIVNAYTSNYDPDEWIVGAEFLQEWMADAGRPLRFLLVDSFSKHGILPYHLISTYERLVTGFRSRNLDAILKLSADIGHYIGDAHVPLHTTKNYNGQLTNQEGIHAFWESRLPELFAESEFDLIVGPAKYIDNVSQFFWECIRQSHEGVPLVLRAESIISKNTPADQQYCFETRLNQVTKLPCYEYSRKYLEALDYQVELRFRDCILAIASVWMSAWVDAGQPDLLKSDVHNKTPWTDSTNLPTQKKFPVREHE